MARFHVLTNIEHIDDIPEVRSIGFGDLMVALREGWEDFWKHPSHLVFLGLIYPIVGFFLAAWSSGTNSWPLLFPLVSGFALIGPVAALPIYEMSRRQEYGLEADWKHALGVFHSPAFASVAAVGVVLLVVFTAWLMVAQFLFEQLFGPGSPASFTIFLTDVFNTPQGHQLMIWGNLIGLLFAVIALATAVVSLPLLLDRDVGAAVAIGTSFRAVLRNPIPMLAWGVIVAALLVLGSIPLLVGLAVVVPWLGHSTWHLYRKVVAPPHG